MAALRSLNPKAEVMGASAALFMNINAAKGLRDVMATNLGPRGTIKMLVGGAGGATGGWVGCAGGRMGGRDRGGCVQGVRRWVGVG